MQIRGIVTGGKRVGRRLGFPTANVAPDHGIFPEVESGVYVARIYLEDGRALPCVLNQGAHPTLPAGAPTIEAHILDFDGDLYGQRVAIDYLAFLRPEMRFESADALRREIARDEERARIWFALNA